MDKLKCSSFSKELIFDILGLEEPKRPVLKRRRHIRRLSKLNKEDLDPPAENGIQIEDDLSNDKGMHNNKKTV